MGDFNDLKGWALVLAGVAGLVAVLAPLANRLKAVSILQFGQAALFNVMGEVAALTSFLGIMYYRNLIHFLPSFAVFLLLFVLMTTGLYLLAVEQSKHPSTWLVAIGALLYFLASACFSIGIGKFSAESLIFVSIQGEVRTSQNRPSPHQSVYLTDTNDLTVSQSLTNRRGAYQFLVSSDTPAEYVVACLTSGNSEEHRVLDANPSSVKYNLTACR